MTLSQTKCETCAIPFDYKGCPSLAVPRFCSRACRPAGMRVRVADVVTWHCQACGQKKTSVPHVAKRKFCCPACASQAKEKWKHLTEKERIAFYRAQLEARTKQVGECWEWQGATQRGYGCFGVGRHRLMKAHRASWIVYKNEDPGDLFVLHKCDNRACCNPDHLFLGTQDDNMKDMMKKGRHVGGRKLKDQQIAEIKNYIRQQKPSHLIAKKYGVSQSCICDIKKGRRWNKIEAIA